MAIITTNTTGALGEAPQKCGRWNPYSGPDMSDVGWGGGGRWNLLGLASQSTGMNPEATALQQPSASGSPACQPICHPVISSTLESRSLGIVDKAHRTRSRFFFSLGLVNSKGWPRARPCGEDILTSRERSKFCLSRRAGVSHLGLSDKFGHRLRLHSRQAKNGFYISKWLEKVKRMVFYENSLKFRFQAHK